MNRIYNDRRGSEDQTEWKHLEDHRHHRAQYMAAYNRYYSDQ